MGQIATEGTEGAEPISLFTTLTSSSKSVNPDSGYEGSVVPQKVPWEASLTSRETFGDRNNPAITITHSRKEHATMKIKRRLFANHRQPPTASLNDAMLSVVREDLRASRCVVCGQPGACMAVWSPTAEVIANELGGDPTRSRQLVYRLCIACANRCQSGDQQFIAKLEANILEVWRSGNVHRVVDGVAV
jgi:ferredoxin